jgi:hypothetical protein
MLHPVVHPVVKFLPADVWGLVGGGGKRWVRFLVATKERSIDRSSTGAGGRARQICGSLSFSTDANHPLKFPTKPSSYNKGLQREIKAAHLPAAKSIKTRRCSRSNFQKQYKTRIISLIYNNEPGFGRVG